MKKLIAFMLLFTVVAMLVIQACNKKENNGPNYPPVAFAGNDTAIIISFCEPTAFAILDAHLSYDPDFNYSLKYLWKQVSGPIRTFEGIDSTQEVVTIHDLVSGIYKFELEVHDARGLSSKDSLTINIRNKEDYKELELDLIGTFEFGDNILDYYYTRKYYDVSSIGGIVNIANVPFNYYFYESSDTAVINTHFTNYFNIYDPESQPKFISGDCSVDFDSLYVKGGGAFDGTIKVTSGSAFAGCESMLQDFPPLQIKGNLNAAAKTVTMKIKGHIVL